MSGVFQVRVPLAKYDLQRLTTHALAKHVLHDFERAHDVVLDFAGVERIDPAFAHEIFNVYAAHHPEVHVAYMNVTLSVRRTIKNAVSQRRRDQNTD